jgi:hypothetical protein
MPRAFVENFAELGRGPRDVTFDATPHRKDVTASSDCGRARRTAIDGA